jgi:hypothetical protein
MKSTSEKGTVMTQYERGLLYLCSFTVVADYTVDKFAEPSSAFNEFMLFLFVKSMYRFGKAVTQ